MLAEASGIEKIILICGYTDLRYGIDGLAQQMAEWGQTNVTKKGEYYAYCKRYDDNIYYQGGFVFFPVMFRIPNHGRWIMIRNYS